MKISVSVFLTVSHEGSLPDDSVRESAINEYCRVIPHPVTTGRSQSHIRKRLLRVHT